MTTAQAILEKVKSLPAEKQEQVLAYVERLQEQGPKKPLFNPEGLWAGRGTHVTEDDITEARKEMWGKYEREE